jgi:hypothetical protein
MAILLGIRLNPAVHLSESECSFYNHVIRETTRFVLDADEGYISNQKHLYD